MMMGGGYGPQDEDRLRRSMRYDRAKAEADRHAGELRRVRRRDIWDLIIDGSVGLAKLLPRLFRLGQGRPRERHDDLKRL